MKSPGAKDFRQKALCGILRFSTLDSEKTVKARYALLAAIVIAIAGTLAVALVRVLSSNDEPESPVTESNAGKLDGPVVDQKKAGPAFTISKETTYVAGPVDGDGCVNYPAALNERLSKGVTPENNAIVLFWKALGPRPYLDRPMPAEFFQLLGIEEPPEVGDYFIGLEKYTRDQLKIEDPTSVTQIEAQLKRTAGYPWVAKEHPEVADWLTANEIPLGLIIEASKRPKYFSPVGFGRATEGTQSILTSIDPVFMRCS
jgi:hypothetical protein